MKSQFMTESLLVLWFLVEKPLGHWTIPAVIVLYVIQCWIDGRED